MRNAVLIYILFFSLNALGQEHVGALYRVVPTDSVQVYGTNSGSAAKGTAVSLPFFEDFSYDSFFPDTAKWVDRKVYINNNMGVNPVTRGVATFDAIAENGLPYEKTFKTLLRYCDSLTSQDIDLSGFSAGDSVYLSFFYQPQGNGFDPQPEDSLMLYFRRANTTAPWTRVWRVAGSTLQPFTQVMVPVTDANMFHAKFAFRFINKASMNNSDDHWHIDYIKMDANRTINDTLINDVAFVQQPTFILNDYTYMPYHQFIANVNAERATDHETSIKNNTNGNVTVNYGYNATESVNGTNIGSGNGSVNIPANTETTVSFPVYTNTGTAPAKNEQATFENEFYLQQNGSTGPLQNDTITRLQHFHNYLAYDDGTAEKSYYLNLFATLPGKIAIEHRLNVDDTLKGMAIYFGRQVPLAYQKYFSLAVYKDIDIGGGTEQLLYQEDFIIPGYLQQNGYWYYKFEQPVPLQAGKFYVGTIQPALGASDSLYFGLDVQRTADNHVFFNVVDKWEQSSISGAVMMRPLFGDFFPSVINEHAQIKRSDWTIIPNPAKDRIRFKYNSSMGAATYTVTDISGRIMLQQEVGSSGWADISSLTPGIYIVNLSIDGKQSKPQTITKL